MNETAYGGTQEQVFTGLVGQLSSEPVCGQAKDPMGGYTFEQSLRRRRAALQERQARIPQKIQLLSEWLRVFEED